MSITEDESYVVRFPRMSRKLGHSHRIVSCGQYPLSEGLIINIKCIKRCELIAFGIWENRLVQQRKPEMTSEILGEP